MSNSEQEYTDGVFLYPNPNNGGAFELTEYKGSLTETQKYRLGMAAGEVFVEKVNALFQQFSKDYEFSDPNFTTNRDESYVEGFWKSFIDNIGFDVDG